MVVFHETAEEQHSGVLPFHGLGGCGVSADHAARIPCSTGLPEGHCRERCTTPLLRLDAVPCMRFDLGGIDHQHLLCCCAIRSCQLGEDQSKGILVGPATALRFCLSTVETVVEGFVGSINGRGIHPSTGPDRSTWMLPLNTLWSPTRLTPRDLEKKGWILSSWPLLS